MKVMERWMLMKLGEYYDEIQVISTRVQVYIYRDNNACTHSHNIPSRTTANECSYHSILSPIIRYPDLSATSVPRVDCFDIIDIILFFDWHKSDTKASQLHRESKPPDLIDAQIPTPTLQPTTQPIPAHPCRAPTITDAMMRQSQEHEQEPDDAMG